MLLCLFLGGRKGGFLLRLVGFAWNWRKLSHVGQFRWSFWRILTDLKGFFPRFGRNQRHIRWFFTVICRILRGLLRYFEFSKRFGPNFRLDRGFRWLGVGCCRCQWILLVRFLCFQWKRIVLERESGFIRIGLGLLLGFWWCFGWFRRYFRLFQLGFGRFVSFFLCLGWKFVRNLVWSCGIRCTFGWYLIVNCWKYGLIGRERQDQWRIC